MNPVQDLTRDQVEEILSVLGDTESFIHDFVTAVEDPGVLMILLAYLTAAYSEQIPEWGSDFLNVLNFIKKLYPTLLADYHKNQVPELSAGQVVLVIPKLSKFDNGSV